MFNHIHAGSTKSIIKGDVETWFETIDVMRRKRIHKKIFPYVCFFYFKYVICMNVVPMDVGRSPNNLHPFCCCSDSR